MRKKIFHNWGLKLGSLVLAFILWLLVIQIGDPKETITFYNIPVNLTNTELLDQQDKVYQVLDGTDRINVAVRAPRSVFENLSASDIVAEADMSKLTEINTIVISCNVMNADVDTVRANPDVLRLNVENRSSKPVNVRYNITGEVAEGYMVASTHLEVNRIEVTGPESAVSRIDHAGVELEVTDATTEDISASVETVLYDADGNVLDLPGVTKTANYVRMDVEVLATKEVPVELNVVGEPADGYLATGVVESSLGTVRIAGRPYYLSNVNVISIPEENLDITGAEDNVTSVINIKRYLPDNIILADSGFDGNVTVTVYVEPEVERTFDVPVTDITVTNVPQDMEVLLPEGESYELRVSGLEEIISALQIDEIRGTIDLAVWMTEEDLEELPVGTYLVPVTFSLPEGIVIENSVVLPITITELEEEDG